MVRTRPMGQRSPGTEKKMEISHAGMEGRIQWHDSIVLRQRLEHPTADSVDHFHVWQPSIPHGAPNSSATDFTWRQNPLPQQPSMEPHQSIERLSMACARPLRQSHPESIPNNASSKVQKSTRREKGPQATRKRGTINGTDVSTRRLRRRVYSPSCA